MDDQVQVDGFRQCDVVIDHMLGAHPESQPVVRRHDQEAARPDRFGHPRMLDGLANGLAADPRNDGNDLPYLGGDDPRDLRSFRRAQREDLACVPVRDQAADPFVAGQPAREPSQFGLVDRPVLIEGKLHRRENASECRYARHLSILVCRHCPRQGPAHPPSSADRSRPDTAIAATLGPMGPSWRAEPDCRGGA